MTTINLRDFYPWYAHNEFMEVPDEVAAELQADRRYIKTDERNRRRHKLLSLDAEDGAEAYVIHAPLSPEAVLDLMERHCRLCRALNSLPDIQGRRIDAHYLCGMSVSEIARREGVVKSSVTESIKRGLKSMKNFLRNSR